VCVSARERRSSFVSFCYSGVAIYRPAMTALFFFYLFIYLFFFNIIFFFAASVVCHLPFDSSFSFFLLILL